MGRMRGIPETPEGLRYLPDFLDQAEEAELLARLRTLDYAEVRMHGQVARRVVRHWGVGYDFDTRQLRPGDAIPRWLDAVRARAAEAIGRAPEVITEALATYYQPGATIGWHRDAPAFGDVVGVSLGSGCLMRFQRGKGDERRVHEQELEPGSGYVLAGAVRNRWEHSIPAVPHQRWSLTFRTIRKGWEVSG
jgi:alkylated DNA repair dioxygenase AlkB